MNYFEMLREIFFSPIVLATLHLPFSLFGLIAGLLLPLLLISLLFRIFHSVFNRLLNKSRMGDQLKERLKTWAKRISRIIFYISIALLLGRLFGAQVHYYIGIVTAVLNQPLIVTGNTKISFITILLMLPVFYLASWSSKAVRGMLSSSFFNRVGLDEARQFSLFSMIQYTVMVVVFLIGLSIIGIDLSVLAVIFGILGIGLGFGLQTLVANLFAGFIIILTRPVKEGDRILVNNYEGTIVRIRLIATIINTLANETIIVPNSHLVSDTVHNYSYEDRSIVVRNEIGVSYRSDLDKVIAVLEETALRNPFLKADTIPFARVREFGNSSINLLLISWIHDVSDKYNAHHWNNLEIWRAFKRESIEIPFPQLDLHLKEGIVQAEVRNSEELVKPETRKNP